MVNKQHEKNRRDYLANKVDIQSGYASALSLSIEETDTITMTKSNRNNLLLRLLKYVLLDILKNRMVLFYTLFLLATSFGLFSMI